MTKETERQLIKAHKRILIERSNLKVVWRKEVSMYEIHTN